MPPAEGEGSVPVLPDHREELGPDARAQHGRPRFHCPGPQQGPDAPQG